LVGGLALEPLEHRQLLSASTLPAAPVSPAGQVVAEPQYRLVRDNVVSPLGRGTASPTGLSPSQIRHAYGFEQILFNNDSVTGDGTGQTIAIVDAYNNPQIANDLSQFDATFGIAAPPSFTKVAQDGSAHFPLGNTGWGFEEAIDVEWAHAIAPGAAILLVEANSAQLQDLDTAVDYARQQTGVVVVSMSYGNPEFSGETSDDAFFTTPTGHAGVTFVAATGDHGKPGYYPAMSPNVVAVGGTVLTTDSAGDYLGETGWGGSGGGISQYETQPTYQAGVVTQSSTNRTIPDVAMDSAPPSGVSVYDAYSEGAATPWVDAAGTSVAAPCWSATIAVADQGRTVAGLGTLDGPTETLPALYQLSSQAFHDITKGNNGFAAGPGYDLVTGLGTPVANLLTHWLIAPAATRTWTGAAGDDNWSEPNNWGGTAPNAGDTLVFGPGASNFTSHDDLPAGTPWGSLVFTSAGYTLTGNAIVALDGLDASQSTGTNACNLDISLSSNSTFTAGPSGTQLTLGGNVTIGASSLTIGGSGGAVEIDGLLSGTGGLTIGDTGTVTLATGSTTTDAIGMLTLAGGSVATGAGKLQISGVTANSTASIGGNLAMGAAKTSWNVASGVVLTVSADVSGSAALVTTGPGTLVLDGANTYANGTTVGKGTLIVNGSVLNTVTVNKSGTLAGSGSAGPIVVNAGGNVAPGTPGGATGTLSVGNAQLKSGSSFTVALAGDAAGTGYDQLIVSGTVNLSGAKLHMSVLGFTPTLGQSFEIVSNGGTGQIVGTFSGLAEGAILKVGGMTFQISYVGGDGNDVVLTRVA
jgi:autotransporter-associated beta strand protein